MSDQIYERYAFAKSLIKQAGELALSFYQKRQELHIESKLNKLDEVSIADKEVEHFIFNNLRQKFPNDGFLGEESGSHALDHEFCWVIDPIDGTSPFLHGLHAWCISIAVLQNQSTLVCGLIFDPLHNELFHCYKGSGAYLNNHVINTNKQAQSVQDGLIGLGMSHRIPPSHLLPFLSQLLDQKGMYVRNGSGALTLAQVSAGRLAGYFEPHLNAWDCLAGILLIHEAGGMTNNFLLNDGLYKGNYILAAATSHLYQQLNSFRSET